MLAMKANKYFSSSFCLHKDSTSHIHSQSIKKHKRDRCQLLVNIICLLYLLLVVAVQQHLVAVVESSSDPQTSAVGLILWLIKRLKGDTFPLGSNWGTEMT